MKVIGFASVLLATSPVLAGVSISPARPEQLNSTHHRLRVQLAEPGQISEAADDSASRLAVGATVTLVVPSQLGLGHGPFFTVYDEPATLAVKTDDAVEVSPPRGDLVDVRCKRAGVFELAIDVTAHGKHLTDTVALGCIAPTRFTATNVHAAPDPYLAGASEVTVVFDWYGRRDHDRRDTKLVGTLPVAVAPGETAIAPATVLDGSGAYITLHGATSVSWVSAGLTATLPIEIVDRRSWKLDLAFQDTREIWHGAHVAIARARAVDERGRMFAGLHECALATYHGDVANEPATSCMARVVRSAVARRDLPRSPWTADRVCFAVLDQQACEVVAE